MRTGIGWQRRSDPLANFTESPEVAEGGDRLPGVLSLGFGRWRFGRRYSSTIGIGRWKRWCKLGR